MSENSNTPIIDGTELSFTPEVRLVQLEVRGLEGGLGHTVYLHVEGLTLGAAFHLIDAIRKSGLGTTGMMINAEGAEWFKDVLRSRIAETGPSEPTDDRQKGPPGYVITTNDPRLWVRHPVTNEWINPQLWAHGVFHSASQPAPAGTEYVGNLNDKGEIVSTYIRNLPIPEPVSASAMPDDAVLDEPANKPDPRYADKSWFLDEQGRPTPVKPDLRYLDDPARMPNDAVLDEPDSRPAKVKPVKRGMMPGAYSGPFDDGNQ